ncbi:MAG TPA: 50S ribosomal protein L32e [Candidatus Nanoarchaeia archaeon]|nr:50S ribosomal protein L32e [Candidatus Nanoarchaeia archaeon]
MKQALELRNQIKARRPAFIRQDNPKRMKVNSKWRKPKGVHSKIRHHFKGRRKMPSPGYRVPAIVRGLHASGLKPILVHSSDELSKINIKTEGIVVAKTTGNRKRLEILKKSIELNIKVLNLNANEHISKIEDRLKSKKEEKSTEKATKEAKEKSKKKEESKGKEKSDEKKEVPEDKDKKELEKEEMDKVLTQKG